MTRTLIKLLALLALLLPLNADVVVIIQPAGPPTYLVSEDFEGTGTPAGWTDDTTSGGTIDHDYATSPAPLVGSQSVQIDATTTGHINTSKTFAAQSTVECYVQIYMDNAGVGGVTSTARLVGFWGSSGATEVGTLRYDSSNLRFNIICGSTVVSGTIGSHYDTLYHVWLRYVKGTGANATLEAYISTTGTKPGSPTISTSAGTSTVDADQLRVITGGRNHDPVIYDKVRVNPSIGSDPT
jgi:hypothetical protein